MTGRSIGPSLGGKLRHAVQSKRLLLALLAGTCLSPVGAAAQTTWSGNTSTYGSPGNWSLGIPSSTGTGIFTNTAGTFAVTGVGGDGVSAVGTWQFQPGAPAYTFAVSSDFAFNVGGIVNNSAQAPAINIGIAGGVSFANSAGAGNATITNNAGFGSTGLVFIRARPALPPSSTTARCSSRTRRPPAQPTSPTIFS